MPSSIRPPWRIASPRFVSKIIDSTRRVYPPNFPRDLFDSLGSRRMVRHVLPRVGYSAVGLLYATIGVVAARIAFLGAKDRAAGMDGSLAVLFRQQEGRTILAVVAGGLACFAAWRLIQTFTFQGDFITRVGWAITAIGYAALTWTAIGLLLRFPRGENFERMGVGMLLPSPLGRGALRLAAAILIVVGVVAIFQGVTGRLPRWLRAAGQRAPG